VFQSISHFQKQSPHTEQLARDLRQRHPRFLPRFTESRGHLDPDSVRGISRQLPGQAARKCPLADAEFSKSAHQFVPFPARCVPVPNWAVGLAGHRKKQCLPRSCCKPSNRNKSIPLDFLPCVLRTYLPPYLTS